MASSDKEIPVPWDMAMIRCLKRYQKNSRGDTLGYYCHTCRHGEIKQFANGQRVYVRQPNYNPPLLEPRPHGWWCRFCKKIVHSIAWFSSCQGEMSGRSFDFLQGCSGQETTDGF